MDTYIFTSGRELDQITYCHLPEELKEEVRMVVYEDEQYAYNTFKNVVAVPNTHKGIARKRQYILDEYANGGVVFLDDDLTFARRRTDDPSKFAEATTEDIKTLWYDIEYRIQGQYAHGGIAMREGANRDIKEFKYSTRICRAHYYDSNILLDLDVRFDRLPCMEDFDVSLQLLRAGFASRTINAFVQNQSGSGKAGGCSQWRTPAIQAEAAHGLKELHPDFVTVVQKETKAAWGGGTRTDVRIEWKKALREGLARRGVHRGQI